MERPVLMAAGDMYDVLIWDIGLPGMDRIELMQRVRAHGQQKLPFAIALSGYGDALIRTRKWMPASIIAWSNPLRPTRWSAI